MKKKIKNILRGPLGSSLIALYYRTISLTSRHIYDPPDKSGNFGSGDPVIYATWHGHSFIFGFRFRKKNYPTLMVARHGDGRMFGQAMHYLGVPLVYGSGADGKAGVNKGGARAFLQMLKVLRKGKSVTMTADVPKSARVVGEGVILLARKARVPIVPVAMTTSRRKFVSSWDRMEIHKPFSRLVYVVGDQIDVPDDDTPLKPYQEQLYKALQAAQTRAYDIADKGRTPGPRI